MEITVLQSWDDFRIELEKLAQIRESLKNNLTYPDIWVFRGQTRAWDLDTTYERKTRVNEYSMRGYLDLMKRVCPEIKACKTSISWAALDLPEYADWYQNWYVLGPQGLWAYMIYLRHHGFPSPLLDWTKSPDVAAYFAFRDVSGTATAEPVSICAFMDTATGSKSGWAGEPNMSRIRHDIFLEERHKRQQSTYTYCWVEREEEHIYYCSHENVFRANRRNSSRQDELRKYTIPARERSKVLEELKSRNISEETLFDTPPTKEELRWFTELFEKWYC